MIKSITNVKARVSRGKISKNHLLLLQLKTKASEQNYTKAMFY